MKKLSIKFIGLLTSAVFIHSCADLDLEVESGVEAEKPTSIIVDEKVSSYDVLKSYVGDVLLGINASSDEILGNSAISTLSQTNFNQVTPATELYAEGILSDDGVYDFSSIEDYLRSSEKIGLSVYGDPLISNLNQNETYLNSLIEPFTFLTPLFPNMVKHEVFEDGSLTGWNTNGTVSVEEYLGQLAVKMENGTSVSSSDETSLQSPSYVVEDGANFEMTLYLLSNKVGEGRVVFSGLNNNEPELDWKGDGYVSSTFETKIGWNKINFQIDDFDGSGEFAFKIELGYTPDVSYYLNVQGISLINVNGSVDNPDEIFLECEDAQEIGEWMTLLTDDETSVSGGEYLSGIIDGDWAANDVYTGTPDETRNKPYSFTYTFNVNTAGTYRIWLRQRARQGDGGDDSFFMSVDGAEFYCPGWPGWGDDTNTKIWTWLKLYTNSSDKEGSSLFDLDAGEHQFSIKIREGDHHFDKVYLTMTSNEPKGLGTSAIAQEEVTLDISEEEKKTAIDGALNDYVTEVLTSENSGITAWTVVKNPFAEDGSVAISDGSDEEGTFYWADYTGDDYIAQAFSIAKANASSESKLFISETDLNTNSVKLNAIISSMNSISGIDGIAASLELDLDSDLDKVGSMLEELAGTGKLVSITNLKVKVPNIQDEVNDALSGEVYQKVVELFKSKVPTAQQYGISLYTAVDIDLSDDTYSYDYAGLWDSDYNRKQAYVGFVVGFGAQE